MINKTKLASKVRKKMCQIIIKTDVNCMVRFKINPHVIK